MSPKFSGLLKCINDRIYQLIWISAINLGKFGTSLLNLLIQTPSFSYKNSLFQVANINCSAYLKIDVFLQLLLTRFRV